MTTAEPATEPSQADLAKAALKQSNDDRRAAKLEAKIQRAHDWRVQVWAQSELRIRGMNAELEAMGRQPIAPFEPDFDDEAQLRHYSEMTLAK